MTKSQSKVKKIILIVAGGLALGLGGIGMFLPILPTTPFVLCAAACFSASSPELYKKLEKNRYFGEYIQNYKNKTGISRKARVRAIAFLWITLGISAIIFTAPHVRIILAIVGIAVTIHLLTIRRAVPVTQNTQIEKTPG